MNKLNLFIKIIITILGLILIFNGVSNNSIWFYFFVSLVVLYLILDTVVDRVKRNKNI
ncbi:hypothetical protein [Oceanobacillus arenosus]|uniref:hypothetical protein n=1 Tax=Oceanobacillus arenosus TaxID=1229153 RepID=UPI001475BCD5|nr:hypothetical protein [Oceanobacillus arenosus]